MVLIDTVLVMATTVSSVTNTAKDELKGRKQRLDTDVSIGLIDEETRDAIKELAEAYDSENYKQNKPPNESHRTLRTIHGWVYRLTLFAREINLSEATIDDIRVTLQTFKDGTTTHHDESDGLSTASIRNYGSALRRFYTYHDYGINPKEIPLPAMPETKINPSDMLTRAEIDELRTTIDNPRDELIFSLLLFTGQRVGALRVLRVKDVSVDSGPNGSYRYNDTASGQKGVLKRQGNRPLLGATGSVRRWLTQYHPAPKPNNYLITQQPTYHSVAPTEPVSKDLIRRSMKRLKEQTAIDKPLHPHAFRHNFVSLAINEYDIKPETVKQLIGHKKGSRVLESTYSHISAEDHRKHAEEQFGTREPKETSSHTPYVCTTCGKSLADNARACENCGEVFTLDAKATEDMLDDAILDAAIDADTDKAKDDINSIQQLVEDNKEAIINVLSDELESK